MKFLDNKEIQYLQKYFADMENIEYIQLNGLSEIGEKADDNEFSNKKISTKIVIDFFLNEVKVYLVIPHKEIKQETEKTLDGREKIVEKTVIIKKSKLIFTKKFKISEDFKSVETDGKIYNIPDYFNQESVKNKDDITWQIIFYQVFNDEITKEINGK